MPAVSVVMPAYNVLPYVGEAITSVLAQTFSDLEIIVADDGSTDETLDILRDFAARDARVRVVTGPNGGISTARNRALREATGRVIAILDADDVWDREYLSTQIGILQAHPEIAIVTGNAWYLGSRLDGRPARPCPDSRPHPDLAAMLQDETAVFIMSTFRREVYDAIGGFDETMRTNEDYDYWLRAAMAGFRFYRNDLPLGRYRRRDDSLSANDARMLRGVLRVLDKTRPHLAGRPRELEILERKVNEFETKLLAAEARQAIEAGDLDEAAGRLSQLRGRKGSAKIRVAWLMARWAPGLLARAYRLRRGLQGGMPS